MLVIHHEGDWLKGRPSIQGPVSHTQLRKPIQTRAFFPSHRTQVSIHGDGKIFLETSMEAPSVIQGFRARVPGSGVKQPWRANASSQSHYTLLGLRASRKRPLFFVVFQ
ncbi:unnamed protein product [Symbiodinium natans]|uniref:Uncharacterized protein n=1 Tax=Symbiodinium natans TaxID=878477 RepID=A0A812RJ33_9DINO|nr:unnamed protein product [Symbiodinium natans]